MKNSFKPSPSFEPIHGAQNLTSGIWVGIFAGKSSRFIVDDESPSSNAGDRWTGIMQVEDDRLIRVYGSELEHMSFVPYNGTITLSNM